MKFLKMRINFKKSKKKSNNKIEYSPNINNHLSNYKYNGIRKYYKNKSNILNTINNYSSIDNIQEKGNITNKNTDNFKNSNQEDNKGKNYNKNDEKKVPVISKINFLLKKMKKIQKPMIKLL